MKLLTDLINQNFVAAYTPLGTTLIKLPNLSHLITIERILLLALFIVLAIPLLTVQKNLDLETKRIKIIKLSAIISVLSLIIRIYKLLSKT